MTEGLAGVGHFIADTAYDADHFRRFIDVDLGATAEIPCNPSRAQKHALDGDFYKARHLVDNFFHKIKRFRRIALRCEKTLSSFGAFVALACTMAWLA